MRQLAAAVCFLMTSLPVVARAESHNPADYPLRIHIFRRNQRTFYFNRQEEETKGQGRANLFEASMPKGLDFQFDCDQRLQTSAVFETFPAKWKKPGLELVILQPQFGKTGYATCRLEVMMKDFVYVSHDGNLMTAPAEQYHTWMVRHQYDPENGKNTPLRGPIDASGANGAPTDPVE